MITWIYITCSNKITIIIISRVLTFLLTFEFLLVIELLKAFELTNVGIIEFIDDIWVAFTVLCANAVVAVPFAVVANVNAEFAGVVEFLNVIPNPAT